MCRYLLFLLISIHLYGQSTTSLLTEIARDSIVESLSDQTLINKTSLINRHPFLNKKGATFVTLSRDKRLRGCIGSLKARRPLIDDLRSNAKSAAFKDTRFLKLRKDELRSLEVEVSLLGKPQTVVYDSSASLKRQIVKGKDGIILQKGNKHATYLPQVWEQLNSFDEFFSSLCVKAKLSPRCLEKHPDIFRYRVKHYSEKDLSRRPMSNAGLFYPKQCQDTQNWFTHFKEKDTLPPRTLPETKPRALVVPHAGYIYSGYTADLAYRLAQKSRAKRVILIGPSHRSYFEGISASEYEALQTPCGILRNDEKYLQKIKKMFSLKFVQEVHKKEHSTEVQFPFIHHYLPQTKVVELIYGKTQEGKLEKLMAYLLKDSENLLIISSDLSHYYTKQEAHKKDYICLNSLERMDENSLKNGCEACGYEGIKALIKTAREMKLKSKLLDYRTSSEATGNTQNVVGYTSAMFWK